MKVLLLNQVFHPDPVATAQHLTDLALYLQNQGYRVTVLCGQRDYEHREKKYPLRETFHDVEIRRVPSTGFGKKSFLHRLLDSLTFDLSLLWQLVLLPKQDVVVSFTSPPLIGVVGALYCWLRGKKSVQWLMDINPDIAIEMGYMRRTSLPARFLTWLFELSLKLSHRIVVLDRWMKDRVVAHGANPQRIAIVPPWAVHDVAPIAPEEKNPFREAHGLSDKFVILYSGNHSIVHPLDTLLDAAVRLKDDPTVRFVFIGGGLRVKDVREAVQRHGLANVMQLPHQPREMLRYSLSSADLHVVVMGNSVNGLVHTSKLYGILATGRPYVFIGPSGSHVADTLHELPYGYHVEHGQADALLEVIKKARALSRPEKITIAEKNTTYVTDHNTAERCLRTFVSEVLQN